MLDLDARVHLDEVDAAVFVHQELDRAGVPVTDLLERIAQFVAELLAQLRSHLDGGRLLEQLLMPALDTALALAERDDVAMLIGEDLELDVARALDELLHV